jgi:hypothetical protein
MATPDSLATMAMMKLQTLYDATGAQMLPGGGLV